MHSRPYHQRHRGFSLVELLIVITIIGVIAGIAILSFSDLNGASRVTTAKAQAQRIAATFEAGKNTGAPLFVAADSLDTAMNAVGAGSFGTGTFRSSWVQLGGISANMDSHKPLDEQARHYLTWEDNILVYDASGDGGSGIGSENPPPPDNESPWRLFTTIPGFVPVQLVELELASLRAGNPQSQFRYQRVGNEWHIEIRTVA